MYDQPTALSLSFGALLCLQRKQRKHVLQLIPSRDVKPGTYGWTIGPCEASPITESSSPRPGSRVHPGPPMILNFVGNFIQATSLKPNLLYRTFLGSDPLLWSLAICSCVQYPGVGNWHHFLESLERPSVTSFDQLLVFC